VELVQQLGHGVHIVPGSARNFKITTPEDWTLAQQLWPHWAEDVTS
jgi:2-C-methyl-D-erythritol 4-phosphate cytidylyltransferase